MEKLFTSDAERKGAFVHYELRDARTKALITELTDYAARTKELRLPRTKAGDFTLKTTRRAGTLFIEIQSKTLLKDAYIDLGETGWQLSDNFLDILPGRRYRLRALPTRRQPFPPSPSAPSRRRSRVDFPMTTNSPEPSLVRSLRAIRFKSLIFVWAGRPYHPDYR